MNGRIRTGLFPHERKRKGIRFDPALDWKGMYDPRLSADCRCADGEVHSDLISPWIALSSSESWGDSVITPQGLVEGDTSEYGGPYIPLEETLVCDIYGNPLNSLNGDDYND